MLTESAGGVSPDGGFVGMWGHSSAGLLVASAPCDLPIPKPFGMHRKGAGADMGLWGRLDLQLL